MKKFIIYVAVNFLFLVVYVPMYINIPSLPVGYKAYVYCNEDNCNQGYVLNVENSTNDEKSQKVEARFLDEKDKIVFTRLLITKIFLTFFLVIRIVLKMKLKQEM